MADQVLEETLAGTEEEEKKVPVEDPMDHAADYLMGRQLAEEYHDPVTRTALESLNTKEGEQSGMQFPREGSLGTVPYSPSSTMPVKKPEHYYDVNNLSFSKDQEGKTVTTHKAEGEIPYSPPGLEEPLLNPELAIPVGGAMPGILAIMGRKAGTSALRALVPSIPRMLASAGTSGVGEYATGITAEQIQENHPDFAIPPWLFSVGTGIASGITVERFAEDFLVKNASKYGKSAANLLSDARAGNFNNPVVKQFAESWHKLANEDGIILGENAKNIDLFKFNVAKRLVDKEGKDPYKVMLATGFFKGGDGRWRWIASDKDYNIDFDKWRTKGTTDDFGWKKMDQVVTDPKLFEAYPFMRDIVIEPKQFDDPKAMGNTNLKNRSIEVNRILFEKGDWEAIKRIVRHETTHWVQEAEGLSGGGSWHDVSKQLPEEFQAEVYRLIGKTDPQEAVRRILSGDDDLTPIDQKILDDAAYNVYRKLAGETEARNAVKMWIRGDSERIANFPEAMKVWMTYQKNFAPGAETGNVAGLDMITSRMKELGFDMTDPKVEMAFETGDFSKVIPSPEILKNRSDLIWKVKGGQVDPDTQEFLASSMANSERIYNKTMTTYKQFRTLKTQQGQVFPLFIGKETATPIGEWVPAEFIPTKGFAERPGQHSGVLPFAPHLRDKQGRIQDGRIWAKVEIPADIDYTGKELGRGEIPVGGYFEKTTSKHQGSKWFVSGDVKVNQILSNEEVADILRKAGKSEEEIQSEMVRDPKIFEQFKQYMRGAAEEQGNIESSEVRYVNSRQYARDKEAELSKYRSVPEEVAARKARQKQESAIRDRISKENPPPAYDTKLSSTQNSENIKKWQSDLNNRIDEEMEVARRSEIDQQDNASRVHSATENIRDRFGISRDDTMPMIRLALRNNRDKILADVGGDVKKVAANLRKQGYPTKIASNIQRYLQSEEDLPFPTSVIDDAQRVMKYKGLSSGADWYRETALDPLVNGLPENEALRLFALIAHTSRQSDPQSNLTKTLKVWKKYLAGATPEEAAKGSGLGENRIVELLSDDKEIFKIVRDEMGQEEGEVKVRDFARTIQLGLQNPELLRDFADAVVDFRMAQIYFPTRTHLKWDKGSERAGSFANATVEQNSTNPIQKERIKERVLAVRDYLRQNDDPTYWDIDRVQAALWTDVKVSRVAEGKDRPSPNTSFEIGFKNKAAKFFKVKPSEVTKEMIEGYVKAEGVAPLGKYKLSMSPITKQENIDQAIAEGDYESANAMQRALNFEKAGDYDSLQDVVTRDVEKIFDDPTIEIVWSRPAQGRWRGGHEFSLDINVRANDYDILKGKVASFLRRYRQTEGYISELNGFSPSFPKNVPVGEQGPSILLKFDRALSEDELDKIATSLDAKGIGGSTYREDGNELVLDHLLKYSDNWNDFRKNVEEAVNDFMKVRGMPVPRAAAANYKHDIMEGKDYARSIVRGQEKADTLGFGRAEFEPRGTSRAVESIQKQFTPSNYSSLGATATKRKRGIFSLLKDEGGGATLDPLTQTAYRLQTDYRFAPEDVDLPFKDEGTLDKIANINLNHIKDEKGIHDVIEQMGKIVEDSGMGTEARRGVQSNRATRLGAVNPNTMSLEKLLGRKPGEMFNDKQALAARMTLVSSAQNLVGLAQKAASVTASDLDRAAFVRALNLHGAIQAQVSGMTAEAGRLLQSFKILANDTALKTRQLQETLQKLPNGLSSQEIAAAISTFSNPAQVGKFVSKIQHATTADMAIELWINCLLSGLQTHVVNTASTATTTLLQIPERWLAGQFARALGHQDSIESGEASRMWFGMIEGFRDGLKSAGSVMKTGEAIDAASKIEVNYPKAITAENIRNLWPVKKFSRDMLADGGIAARAVDLLGSMVRIPTTALQAEDTFFKSIAYRMELQARAYREAVQKFPDDAEKQAARIAEILDDPEKNAPDIALGAVDFSRYATFTNSLGKYSGGLAQLASHPAMKVVLPFVKTPTNILKFGLERSPFGVLNVLRSGTNVEKDLALARMSLGSMVMASTVAFAANGMVTGGGPSDPQIRAALMRTGWQPYSIKVGDKYYSYNRIEPMGMVMGLAADFAEMTTLAADDWTAMYDDFGDLATAIVASIAKNVTSKTWLKGMSNMTNALSDPEYYGKKWVEQLAGSTIPSALAGAERVVDPELSAVWGMVDSIKARIPGFSKDLPPKRDYWGEPVGKAITENNWLQGFYSAASPVYISEKKDSPIDKELVRLKIGLPMPTKSVSVNGIKVPLESMEYDDYVKLINSVPVEDGKNLKESLNALIEKDQYKKSNADIKEAMIKKYVSAARQVAAQSLYSTNITVKEFVDDQMLKKQQQGGM